MNGSAPAGSGMYVPHALEFRIERVLPARLRRQFAGPVRSRSRLTYSRALDTEKAFGPGAATDHFTCTGISPVAYRW